ncbi:MAG: hypothetical protein OXG15_06390 [Gammaproteobacteria bacterium]|nr:hypothetical protein [Gammaproteobacteria bacterium]
MDLDVIPSLTDRKVDALLEALRQRYWTSRNVITDWLIRAEHRIVGSSDLLVTGTEYDVGAISRAPQVVLDEDHVYKTLAVEDVLIFKIIVDRFQDKEDVESIPVRRPELDWIYRK